MDTLLVYDDLIYSLIGALVDVGEIFYCVFSGKHTVQYLCILLYV